MPRPALIALDPSSAVPTYRQIANALRDHLVNGALKPGDILPPVRQLAMDLGVHFNTVAQAYRLLADEGWLDLKRRRGALVQKRNAPNDPDPQHVGALLRRLREMTAELRAAGVSRRQLALTLRQIATGLDRS